MQLLPRKEFRAAVFKRDQYKCVICGENGVDAHHILERRLFKDGGYYLDNGATLCALHHLAAEDTSLSCSTIRTAAKITKVLLPQRLEEGLNYDKWGNVVLLDGKRLKGPLFFEEPVQKVLKQSNSLSRFLPYAIAPKPIYLSPNLLPDFSEKEIVCYEAINGETCSFYYQGAHLHPFELCNKKEHPLIYPYWKALSPQIPIGWRLVGKIQRVDKQLQFQLQSIWDEYNDCLSWQDSLAYAALLDLTLPPVIFQGKYEELLPFDKSIGTYILRLAAEFGY